MSKKLLLVDDEEFFLEGLKEGLTRYEKIFTTDVCYSVDDAIKQCKKIDYDLIVSDIRMPKKSGLDLFVHLRKNNYKGGFIAMTAFGTPEILKRIKTLGGLDIILKPFNLEWFTDKIIDYFSEEEGVSGTINAFDITSLLQMINLERKDVAVKIDLKGKAGYLFFNKGEIIHAEFEDLKGENAAKSLLNLNRGKFSLAPAKKNVKKTINTPFMVLLMNAMKSLDEDVNLLAAAKNLLQDQGEPGEKLLGADTGKKEVEEKPDEPVEKEDSEGIDVKQPPESKMDEKVDKDKEIEQDNLGKETKEVKHMNIPRLNEAIEVLKNDLGDGLLASDIFGTADGQSVAGWNTNEQACALFNQITNYMVDALTGSGFPALGRYYILDLVDNKLVIVIPMGDYQWGMLLDSQKAKLGLMLNVVVPKIIDAFEEAIAG